MDFNLSEITQCGPSHLLTFEIIAHAILSNTLIISMSKLQTHLKKEAQKLASLHLLNLTNNN